MRCSCSACWVDRLTVAELNQLLFIYTTRANLVLADFIREVYWARYSAGRNDLELEDARKGSKDRYAMLSPVLLENLLATFCRAHYRLVLIFSNG